jgi:tRNA A-37 threonylcarbamoyl transferase component Bud32
VDADPDQCPECGQQRYQQGWKPLDLCPHPYLGYLLDERYLLDRYLGGGASGQVYRAMDRKLDRPFALKIVELGQYHDEDKREEHVRRFRNEVQALSRLRNPHVINIYESFQLENHTAALLTEYIDGVTLDEMFDSEGALGFDRSVQIIRQIANGLHEAHQQGVIHRDIKPANVMVEALPAAGVFARILDFGLVHLIEEVSQTHGFRGTPLYASPEQCRAGDKVDGRSDIYALGCVLFHALTGEPPFVADDAVTVMEAHCQKPPPALNDIRPTLRASEELESLLARMLRKQPDERPDDLHTVIEALDEIVRAREAGDGDSEGERGETPSDMQAEGLGGDHPSTSTTTVGVRDEREQNLEELPAELLQAVELEELLTGFPGRATALEIDGRGRCIVLADAANRVHVISRGSREYVDAFDGARMRVTDVAVHLSGGHLYAAEMNGTVLRWTIDRTDEQPVDVVEFSERVLALDVDARGRELFVGTEGGPVGRQRASSSRGPYVNWPSAAGAISCWSGWSEATSICSCVETAGQTGGLSPPAMGSRPGWCWIPNCSAGRSSTAATGSSWSIFATSRPPSASTPFPRNCGRSPLPPMDRCSV